MGRNPYFAGEKTSFLKGGFLRQDGVFLRSHHPANFWDVGEVLRRGMGLDQNLDIPSFKFHLSSERLRAISAKVFVLVSIRKDQKKALTHRNCLAATSAKKGAGFKLFKGGLGLLGRVRLGRFMRFHEFGLIPTTLTSGSMQKP